MTQAIVVKDNEIADYTPGADVTAGDVTIQSTLVGIPSSDIADSELGSLTLTGQFDVVKITGAISVGVAVYWDATGDPLGGTAGTGAATTTAAGNTYFGQSVLAAAETDTTVRLILRSTDTVNAGLANVIADPGDGNDIVVTRSGSVSLVTAAAETRGLPIPTFVGQELNLGFTTDVDDCVITAASAVNQTGNNTLTFADAGDQMLLISIYLGAALVWRIVSNDGVALTTV